MNDPFALIVTLPCCGAVLPTVAVALLFSQLFAIAPENGPVDSILHLSGMNPVDWFASGDKAFVVIIAMDMWRSVGLFAVILGFSLITYLHVLLGELVPKSLALRRSEALAVAVAPFELHREELSTVFLPAFVATDTRPPI